MLHACDKCSAKQPRGTHRPAAGKELTLQHKNPQETEHQEASGHSRNRARLGLQEKNKQKLQPRKNKFKSCQNHRTELIAFTNKIANRLRWGKQRNRWSQVVQFRRHTEVTTSSTLLSSKVSGLSTLLLPWAPAPVLVLPSSFLATSSGSAAGPPVRTTATSIKPLSCWQWSTNDPGSFTKLCCAALLTCCKTGWMLPWASHLPTHSLNFVWCSTLSCLKPSM